MGDGQHSGTGTGAAAADGAAARSGPPVRVHPLVQHGCQAGFLGVVATIGLGVFGTLTSRQQLYSRMLRYRIILVGTTLGLYVTGTGFVPVPPPIIAIFGPPTRAQLPE